MKALIAVLVLIGAALAVGCDDPVDLTPCSPNWRAVEAKGNLIFANFGGFSRVSVEEHDCHSLRVEPVGLGVYRPSIDNCSALTVVARRTTEFDALRKDDIRQINCYFGDQVVHVALNEQSRNARDNTS